jgi:hypothetical protein
VGKQQRQRKIPHTARQDLTAKISIALVSHDMVPVTFAYDLANMTAFSAASLPEGWQFGMNLVPGTYVHCAREQMLKGDGTGPGLLEQGVTHILWVDTDMRFPRDSLARLWKHNVDMVGVNYSTRTSPSSYVAIKEVGDDVKVGSRLETTAESTGIEEVDAIGFGMVLMKAKALECMPYDEPWFWFEFLPNRKQTIGEDVYFCNLFKKHGGKIYVDHDLSKQIAHVGTYEYTLEDVHASKEVLAGV